MKFETDKILDLIRSGDDRKVIPSLYEHVLPQLKNFIKGHRGKKEDAHDVFQDALMLFYEQVVEGTFDPKYNVYGYVYRIAVFRWVNKVKRDQKIVSTIDFPDIFEDESLYEYYRASSVSDGNLLERLFSTLGEKCLELLTYSIYTDMQAEDIMLRMNYASIDTVRTTHMRCKKRLLMEIEKHPELIEKIKEHGI